MWMKTARKKRSVPADAATSIKTIKINKHGQALGRKGNQTRQRLMDATRRLLKHFSPVELTAVSIAKEAKTSSATFYIYFDDVHDIIYALSEAAGADLVEVHRILEEPWDPTTVEISHAQRVVDAFNDVWNRHRDILRFRNLEADRGSRAFADLRINSAIRIIDRFAERILSAYPKDNRPSRGDAFAEATVLFAAMEGMAETDPRHVEEWQIGAARLSRATAWLIARSFGARPVLSFSSTSGAFPTVSTKPVLKAGEKKARVAAKPPKAAADEPS
jgi:AcrR family transcriptional regulator